MMCYLTSATAVTDAELEALEKQIEQQEAEEKKQAEAEAKRKAEAEAKWKAEQKRKAEVEAEKKRLSELEKQLQEKQRKFEDEKKKIEEARLAELEQRRQEEAAERQRLAAEEARLKKDAKEDPFQDFFDKFFEDSLLAGEMIDIPAGSFRMGDISGGGYGEERPVHKVNISSFRMGKHEITFDQWDACVTDGGCNIYNPKDEGWGRGKRPVIYVSWEDAQAFINWMNGKTGGGYRLPSEAEWEYAARAGTETKYPWGDDIGHNNANCEDCGSQWDGKNSAPVGSFPANAFGLYDMHGNVYEWTQDCSNDNYNGAPSDGSAWKGGDCSRRVRRGGSLYSYQEYVRSANRSWGETKFRNNTMGFRLVQDIKEPVHEDVKLKKKAGSSITKTAWLGVYIQDVPQDLVNQFGLSENQGVLIAEIAPNSPAIAAGLIQGDIILKFDKHEIHKAVDMPSLVSSRNIGDIVPVEYLRNGKKLSTKITLGELNIK